MKAGVSTRSFCRNRAAAFSSRTVSGLTEDEREQRLPVHLQEEAATHFDLSEGPLIRGRLLKQSSDEHVLLLTLHHIVSDTWSVGVLERGLTALYAARQCAGGDTLPLPAIQYGDYALWQRARLQGPVLQEQLRYWQQALNGAPPLLTLPADRARPAKASYRGDNVPVKFRAELSGALKELSRPQGATLFMTLCTGFAALLARLSGQDEVVIGTPVAHRPRVELE